MIKEDVHERYEELSDKVVDLRELIYEIDPEYFDAWLGEFVHSPEICLDRIILWLRERTEGR